jgi:hypothetical protein
MIEEINLNIPYLWLILLSLQVILRTLRRE